MKKQLTVIGIIGILLAVGLSGCFEKESGTSKTIKLQVFVVSKYLVDSINFPWGWNNESYIIDVHEGEYFGVPDDSIIVSNKTYCNVSDGKQMFKLIRIINDSNVIIEFNQSVFYSYTLLVDMSHYNPAKDPSWDIIKIDIENPLNLSTQKRVLYPIRGNISYLDWFGEPNYYVKVYLKIIDESEKNKEAGFSNAYEAINGTTFRSIRMLDGGLGFNGPVFMHWMISFENGNFSWSWSDISESGVYECNGWNITGYEDNGKYEHHGIYDKETGILLWEGEEYIRVTEENNVIFTVYSESQEEPYNVTVYNVSIPLDESEAIILYETIVGQKWDGPKEGNIICNITKTDYGWDMYYGNPVYGTDYEINEQNRTIHIYPGL